MAHPFPRSLSAHTLRLGVRAGRLHVMARHGMACRHRWQARRQAGLEQLPTDVARVRRELDLQQAQSNLKYSVKIAAKRRARQMSIGQYARKSLATVQARPMVQTISRDRAHMDGELAAKRAAAEELLRKRREGRQLSQQLRAAEDVVVVGHFLAHSQLQPPEASGAQADDGGAIMTTAVDDTNSDENDEFLGTWQFHDTNPAELQSAGDSLSVCRVVCINDPERVRCRDQVQGHEE